jgi:hypothetical protein
VCTVRWLRVNGLGARLIGPEQQVQASVEPDRGQSAADVQRYFVQDVCTHYTAGSEHIHVVCGLRLWVVLPHRTDTG